MVTGGHRRALWKIKVVLAVLFVLGFAPATAQETQGSYVLNLRETDVTVLAEQVSQITGRTLIIDPTLTGSVTVISTEELDEEGIWSLFQSILRSRGFVAVQSGTLWEVVPESDARARGTSVTDENAGSQDVVTRLLQLNRLPASEAVRVLGPMVGESGYIEAVTDPNAIVITDTGANVDRLFEIARAFDSDAGVQSEVIRFSFANAPIVATAISEVLGPAGTGARLSVDAESNTLLVRGSTQDIAQIRQLASQMDVTPRINPREAQVTSVYRLSFADAETVAEIVRNTLRGGGVSGTSDPLLEELESGELAVGGGAPVFDGEPSDISVSASTQTNAVILRGTARQVDEMRQLIAELDQQRPQIMIEAAIVEVSGEVADRLGVQLGFGEGIPSGGFAASSFSNGGSSLQSILVALGASGASALSTGLTVGVGGNDFGILVQALSQSTQANLLSTPSVTTMDNRPATIVVGQNVPFRTGSFATDVNTVEPFTTIERRDVGITMQVLPRVTAGGVVRLEINQEVSSLVNANVEGAADLITNRRVINTTVEAINGGTIVLGGLITDDLLQTNSKVPGLGDVPVLGNLFRSRSRDITRRTLFVFMRPTVLNSQRDIGAIAERQFNRVGRDQNPPPPPAFLQREAAPIKKLPLEINGLY